MHKCSLPQINHRFVIVMKSRLEHTVQGKEAGFQALNRI